MRTVWRVIQRTIFWSFERGTWPYDIAVVVIVIFVLLSPRSWFHDQPPLSVPPNPKMVQLEDTDPAGGVKIYRVDARLVNSPGRQPESELMHALHEAMQHNVLNLQQSRFEIVRIDPIQGDDGTIAYYDVSIKP